MHESEAVPMMAALLSRLQDVDVSRMSGNQLARLREKVTGEYRLATAGLPQLLLGEDAHDERWIWTVEEPYDGRPDWLSSFVLVDGRPRETRPGSAKDSFEKKVVFSIPLMRLRVDLFARYRDPSRYAPSSEPHLRLKVDISGDYAIDVAGEVLLVSKDKWRDLMKSARVSVQAHEGVCEEIANPIDVFSAYFEVERAVQAIAAEKTHGGHAVPPQTISITVEMDQKTPLAAMSDVFKAVGFLFKVPIIY